MPELPEVETVRRSLVNEVLGKTILSTTLTLKKSLRNKDEDFLIHLDNQKIIAFERKGKNLIMVLDDYFVVLHLRMSGKFYHVSLAENSYNQHNVITFFFKKTKLLFNDPRKFATVDIYTSRAKLNTFLETIGPEPWDIKIDKLFEQIKDKRIAIKSTLLDQKIISGLGNIYVDEVLFASKIIPTRPTNQITYEELKRIITNAIIILKKATLAGGTTIFTFKAPNGIDGKFQSQLQVYGKKGESCPNGAKILRTTVNGRGTYYCPGVQK